jgi:tetratricopeptide (TPR) repeat protein
MAMEVDWSKSHGRSLERASLAFALIVGVVACALPLTGTLGPESALLFALTLCPWVSALAAKRAHASAGVPTATLLAQAIGTSWLRLALPVALLGLNALRVEPCDPLSGLRFIALGPWAGLTLASVAGTLIGSAIARRRWALIVAALLPLLEVGRAAADFVRSPAIFAYGHFFGYFPGTFYDRRVDVPGAWLSHRLLGAVLALGLWALLYAAREPSTGRLSSARVVARPGAVVWCAVLALGSAWFARDAYALQHRSSVEAISAQLGRAIDTPRCRVVLPRELPDADAHRLAEDCEFRISQVERRLGVHERSRITAFFFRSPEEKRALMGAARVYIAKPWRREVYLQLSEYPHPVLAHELAHVVARHASRGWFGVPGKLGGLVPEPTLIEGLAVALEPHARDELTAHQWTKAAQASGIAPPLQDLLGVRFFGTNQALAYTLAGSFLRFVLDTRGAAAVRKVYAVGSVAEALGKPLPELEREWRAYLATVPLPRRAEALARLRFERPGVWSQVCPHLIEQLEGERDAALSAGDLERALTSCQAVLAVDHNDTGNRAIMASVLARRGDLEGAARAIKQLEGPPRAPTPVLVRARTGLADAAFERSEYARAESSYRALLDEPQPENDARQLEVKLLALEATEPARSLLREFLVKEPFGGSDARASMHLIRELALLRSDGLAPYLEARQLRAANRYDLIQSLLRDALARGLPTLRLRVEALRMQMQATFVIGALSEAEAIASQLAQREGATLAEQAEARDFQERVAFRRRATH